MWRTISYISNNTKVVYIYINCIPLHILTKDWPWCNCIYLFFIKSEYPKSFHIISVYRYSMIKSLIIWCNVIHLLTHTLHLLKVCHSKNCQAHLFSSGKQEEYCKITTNNLWLIFNSKRFALVAKFSVVLLGALVLPDF